MPPSPDSPSSSPDLAWAQATTIASYLALATVLLGIWTIVNERVKSFRSEDDGIIGADRSKMGSFYINPLSWWSVFRRHKTASVQVTTIGGLIKAGDLHGWTSADIYRLSCRSSGICWVPLYEAIFRRIANNNASNNTNTNDDNNNNANANAKVVDTHLDRARENAGNLHAFPKNLLMCCRKLPYITPQPPQPRQPRQELYKVDTTLLVGGKPCIVVSREELAALCLVLGVLLEVGKYTLSLSGNGGFGTTIFAAHDAGFWRLHLDLGAPIPKLQQSRGSGYTTLMAKHIACGSLPFAEKPNWILSAHVTGDVFAGLQKGESIQDVRRVDEPSLQYLHRLPNAKPIDAYSGTCQRPHGSLLGVILASDGQPLSGINEEEQYFWQKAVVGIAFGGLVPQSAENLAKAVAFTVGICNNDHLTICIDNLRKLTDQLHTRSENDLLFGENVSKRCEQGQANLVSLPSSGRYSTQEAAKVFSGYMTLLENIMHRYQPGGMDRVYNASWEVITRTYMTAVNTYQAAYAPAANIDQVLANAHQAAFNTYQANIDNNLQLSWDKVLANIDIELVNPVNCAFIVQCILAVWASKVSIISLKDRASTGNEQGEINRPATLDELPPMLVLG